MCVSHIGVVGWLQREKREEKEEHDLENGIINVNAISLLINVTLNQEIYKNLYSNYIDIST